MRIRAGANLGGGGGAQGSRARPSPPHPPHPPPTIFLQIKNFAQAKIQKYNIKKIYQVELRLKETTCLKIIPEAKKTFNTLHMKKFTF